MAVETARVRAAWQGRVSGCILGKPVEVLSFRDGLDGLRAYLQQANALPLRNYIPALDGTLVERLGRGCCRDQIQRAEPDDDLNYTVLALMMLERNGHSFDTSDVARAWLQLLPAGMTWTAERAAYRKLLVNMADEFVNGADAGFDLSICSDNASNEWIGAQIRADLYGWVCPGRPFLAASMARRDASLSHRKEGVHGAEFIAALGAAIPATVGLDEAIDVALDYIPATCAAAAAVNRGRQLAGQPDAVDRLHEKYGDLSPVHTVNNLALVIWALCSAEGDFSAAIGNAVAAGWDTDCNGATVGGLCGLSGAAVPDAWTKPWQGRVAVSLAGCDELSVDDLVSRTIAVANKIKGDAYVVH
jgi:ADP-ribosylglycohydrolase